MKRIIFILCIVLLFIGCKGLFDRKDDELSFVKTPNTSDKMRLDGYYYKYIVPDKVGIRIYYQNGIVYSTQSRDRTGKDLYPLVFEISASTNSAIWTSLVASAKVHLFSVIQNGEPFFSKLSLCKFI